MVIFCYMTVSLPLGWALEALMDKQYNYYLIWRLKFSFVKLSFLIFNHNVIAQHH